MIDKDYKSPYIEKSPQVFRLAAIFLFADLAHEAESKG